MTVPGQDSAIRVLCRVPACASPRSYALHFTMPALRGPYILVGSAFGGDNVRTFADLYMDEVAGLVLDDADPDDVEPKAMQEEEHRGLAGLPSDMRECRNLIAEHKPLPANVTSRPATRDLCSAIFLSGFAGSRVVSGIERQSAGDRANQSRHV